MLFNIKHMRTWWPLATLIATLTLAGCSDDDRKGIITPDSLNQVGSGEMFHGAEWATIKDLDPRGEQCIDCHGKSADMSPNGKLAHNIGLQKHTDHSAYADLKIISVKVDENSGEVTVTLNKNLPADAGNLSMTFAKLAPRVIHNRGHDWQNYFNSNATGRGGNEPKASFMPNGGVQPVTVPSPQVNGRTITFNLGTGREFGTLADFTVKSAYEGDNLSWNYSGIKGTKIKMGDDLATHVYCDAAFKGITNIGSRNAPINIHDKSNQVPDENGELAVCWWPDGTHLTAGTFVTTNNEFVVAYQPDYTHRVTIILGSTAGNPGFNVWYDFVPSVANGKTPEDLNIAEVILEDSSGAPLSDVIRINTNVADYVEAGTGRIKTENYVSSNGVDAPGSGVGNAVAVRMHQALPAARDVVDVQSCNSCHDGLTMHGGSGRSQTQTCVTCHNPGNLQASSGRSVDFKQLIHRLHRGTDLPSEQMADTRSNQNAQDEQNRDPVANPNPIAPDVTAIGKLMNGNKLVANTATDFTKVRFPQGPTPGQAAGITNCVKCHMGEETKGMVQGLADSLGATDFDVQSKMKLAKVTPQGDNWLSVRSVNACQACHDSNIWFADGLTGFGGNGSGSINIHRNSDATATVDPVTQGKLDKYMPFYSADYSDTGYKWLGKKLTRTAEAGAIHNVDVAGQNGRFTCGSSGGCHQNPAITTTLSSNVGIRGNNNNIHGVHLELTRNYILAERFEIALSNPLVAKNAGGKHEFTADVQIIDKRTNAPVAVNSAGIGPFGETFEIVSPDPAFDSYKAIGPQLGPRNLFTGYLGWMNNSPDYNQSAGKKGDDFTEIPGGAANAPIIWDVGSNTGKITVDLEGMANNQWDTLKDNLSDVVGTLAVRGSLGNFPATLSLKSSTIDFRFDNTALNDDEGRRKVVDFLAGQGNDADRDRYAGWDKEHGSNTQSCSSCHLQLSMHAGVTNNAQACVVCHNPQRTDLNSRAIRAGIDLDGADMLPLGVDKQYEESLDLKRLIHGIHSAGKKFRKDPFTMYGLVVDTLPGTKGNSFPGVLSNCQSCHIQNKDGEHAGKWTFDLAQLPKGMIGSTAITADWSKVPFKIQDGPQHDLSNHMKMTPIASVCSSCHDAGYKGGDDKVRTNANILDGGPYIGSHWWVVGGIAPGIVRPNELPSKTKHQSGL